MSNKYVCPRCGGDGGWLIKSPLGIHSETCDLCHGSGRKQITIDLEEYKTLLRRAGGEVSDHICTGEPPF